MLYVNPRLILVSGETEPGKATWRSPANLAIIKYWGKKNGQIPENPSISLTLSESWSETTVIYSPKEKMNSGISLSFSFEEHPNHRFAERIKGYLEKLLPVFPFLRQMHLDIYSRNSFPHSSGIASSASGMSALALCLCSIENDLFGSLGNDGEFRQKASFVSRLGSGSACRSVYGTASLWGSIGFVAGASNDFAVPLETYVHSRIKEFHNAILIIDSREKTISSSKGHRMMEEHPFAKARYLQAKNHVRDLVQVLQDGDVERFGLIMEMEALTLHSLMMSSIRGYFLMTPNSLKILQLVREFRTSTGCQLYFSMDAGPNVHLVYPGEHKREAENFILDVLLEYCEERKWIADKVGQGPKQID